MPSSKTTLDDNTYCIAALVLWRKTIPVQIYPLKRRILNKREQRKEWFFVSGPVVELEDEAISSVAVAQRTRPGVVCGT